MPPSSLSSPAPPERPSDDTPTGRVAGALLLLSAASGAADAFVFLCAGQVFAGVMTGNLVLLGASAAGAGEEGSAPSVCAALVSYMAGAGCGALMARRWEWPVAALLLAEVVLLGVAATAWGLGLVTSVRDRTELLAVVAVAMGIQGMIRVTPTNYFTGTLTSLSGRLALGRPARGDLRVCGRLAAVVAGAALAALAARWWPPGAASVAVVAALGALVLEASGRLARSRR
ncbi:YoaK family protein [Streptomyces sp. AM 2-1-1]|uniref:YoaK family protein n=1 Tax=Streptomyces sp. AM 2-1-1 TaxID=3028709 RepID=UPI0023B953E7|nr:YoaK family protein [Streptomyces sp. AM 2-1-1]WEH43391.1 YoaK family protein [Streptomyces sp. AM 2-1-1]